MSDALSARTGRGGWRDAIARLDGATIGRKAAAWLREIAPGLMLLAAWRLLRSWHGGLAAWTEADYSQPSLLVPLVSRLPSGSAVALGALLAVCLGRWPTWQAAGREETAPLRALVAGVVAVLTWTCAGYEYNLFVDAWHAPSRLLLVALGVGTVFSPWCLPAFLGWSWTLAYQFDPPMDLLTFTDKQVAFDVLLLAEAWLVLRGLRAGISTVPAVEASWFWILLLSLQGANYFVPGLGKLLGGWLLWERLDLLFVMSHLNGWLGRWDFDTIRTLAEWIRFANPLLLAAALAVELAAIAVLASRRTAVALLVSWILLHLGIYLASGIFFWKWILLDAGLIVWLLRDDSARLARVFRPEALAWSVLLIAGGDLAFESVNLAWIDTPLDESYDFVAIDEQGAAAEFPRTEFAPYDTSFMQNRFHPLNRRPVLVGTYGTTSDLELAARLLSAEPADVARLLRERGAAHYDENAARRFDRFVSEFFEHWNLRRDPREWWPVPPVHIGEQPRSRSYQALGRIVRIDVVFRRRMYHAGQLHLLHQEVVRSVPIPPPTAAMASARSPAAPR